MACSGVRCVWLTRGTAVLTTMSKLGKIAVVSIEPHNLRVCSMADDDGLHAFSALRPVRRVTAAQVAW